MSASYKETILLFFLQFVLGNRRAQKYLLIGFEKLVETYQKQLLPKAAHILKSFYDNDLLEEEVVLEWADKVGRRLEARHVFLRLFIVFFSCYRLPRSMWMKQLPSRFTRRLLLW